MKFLPWLFSLFLCRGGGFGLFLGGSFLSPYISLHHRVSFSYSNFLWGFLLLLDGAFTDNLRVPACLYKFDSSVLSINNSQILVVKLCWG